MKRIKRVFTNGDQVLHLWANQSQNDARSKNVFFQGRSAYSYGYHYKLAELVEYNGQTVAVINDTGYRVTTAKHIHSAVHATSHLVTVRTHGDFSAGCIARGMLRRQDELISGIFSKFSRRSGYFHRYNSKETADDSADWVARDVQRFNADCRKLGMLDLQLHPTASFIRVYNAQIDKLNAKQVEKNAVYRAAREVAKKERAEKAKIDLEAWKQGSGPCTWNMHAIRPQLLRVSDKTVETSGGAEVPLTHALKLLDAIERGVAKKGARVGGFTLERVNKKTVEIGCHQIDIAHAKQILAPYKVGA